MCGRYSLITQREDLARALEIAEHVVLADLEAHWNVAPTQAVPALVQGNDLEMRRFRWGLIPHWAKDAGIGARTINARRESVATKPSFRDSFRRRRCAVLADGFYEWKPIDGRKVPHYFRLRSGDPFTFAGLFDRWRDPNGEAIESCTIVTTTPNQLVSDVHDRMPVILDREARIRWLDPGQQDESALQALLEPYAADAMERFPVSRAVNSPRNDGPECLEPYEEEPDEPPSLGPLFDGH